MLGVKQLRDRATSVGYQLTAGVGLFGTFSGFLAAWFMDDCDAPAD